MVDAKDRARLREREANAFAIELLMPEKWIRADLDEHGPVDFETDPWIKEMAQKYEVSQQLMTMRIGEVLGVKS